MPVWSFGYVVRPKDLTSPLDTKRNRPRCRNLNPSPENIFMVRALWTWGISLSSLPQIDLDLETTFLLKSCLKCLSVIEIMEPMGNQFSEIVWVFFDCL